MSLPGQLRLFELNTPAQHSVKMLTYIYIREDGKCAHVNTAGGFIGKEYEHEDPNWQPGPDWPYEVRDMRKESG
ncbi:MAG: hypothetical protein PHF12_00200 [Candidatus Omnitrophica bacterium]|nr:hypothetical protein [Candidatus Omnitrophota bacterium]